MGEQAPIGEFEQLVLLAILRMGEEAYGVTVREEIQRRTGRKAARGAVYTTLDRLEDKGLIRSYQSASQPVQGGRSRRMFAVEPAGLEALEEARESLKNMWEGLEPLLGDLG